MFLPIMSQASCHSQNRRQYVQCGEHLSLFTPKCISLHKLFCIDKQKYILLRHVINYKPYKSTIMKKIKYVFMLLCALLVVSCGSKDSMDPETAKMLEELYGKRQVIKVDKPGTIAEAMKGKHGGIENMKIVGTIDGNDIMYLDTTNYMWQVYALDLLDAHIAACEGERATKENTITENLFGGMSTTLTYLYLPLDLTTIEPSAFVSQWSLKEVRIPATVTSIGESAFSSNGRLQSIELPEGLTELGESAFYGCENLKSLRLPRSITSLGTHLGSFEDLYLSWSPEEFAKFGEQDFSYVEFAESGHTFSFKKPTLHVPAEWVEEYKELMKHYTIVADDAEQAPEAEEVKEEKPESLNTDLLGKWSNNNDPVIDLVVSDKIKDYDGKKGYGYIDASNEYFEMDFKLVFTSVTPDGDNIKVHYQKFEMQFTGDPDDFDSEGTYEEVKVGEGDLTLIPAGPGKLKIDSKESRIKNATLFK